ncbi:expressed unknown protein [Seminavis robusta]|uniref:Ribosomal protein S18 n=1 Tax=Seminavis robusta TaxID=568900 RepID=A0A9N8DAS8_9STRA|nr:expressed unknown protein [Seminavis robusta]|eukprot:Sro61_g035000.1 n/a (410) ;mRNA; r:62909-64138
MSGMKRILTSSAASRSLSFLLQQQCRVSLAQNVGRYPANRFLAPLRSLSTTGGGGSDDGDKKKEDLDPFGMSFDDGGDQGNVGPASQFPPKLKRDATTGKLTGEVERELTEAEKDILQMDPYERDQLVGKRVIESWKNQEDGGGDTKVVEDLGKRVRLAQMSLNVLGRSVKAQEATTVLDDGEEFGRDKETGFTQNLTKSEFESFQKYMEDQHNTAVSEEDIPVLDDSASKSSSKPSSGVLDDKEIHMQGITDDSAEDPDNPDLSLKWLTSRAKWEVSKKVGAEHPFEDMLPRDLNLSRVVNRKRAKPLPTELLHHNNLALLRRYISPAGQIMHRVRTRLGARDQRKIAKLIKRARNLGLIPHSGQFVVEDNGDIYESDIHAMKPWEEELQMRGLTVAPKEIEKEKSEW